MDRSIGINLNKEAKAMLRYKKFPALNHTTKVHTEYSISEDTNTNSNNQKQYNKSSNQYNKDFQFSFNGRTYKMNKQNLATIGFGALVAISAFKTLRSLNRVW